MPQRALITGGAGFIGSHLARKLLDRGDSVIVLDDLSTGRESNIADLRGNPRLQLVKDTVENEATVAAVMATCDVVYHLAAAVGVKLVVEEPVRTIRTTIHGTEVVLDAANKFARPVLITSTSEVYGKGTRVPFSEDDDVVMGATKSSRWSYAYSKGIDEIMALAYHKQYGLPTRIVRLFNTVGPGQVGMYGMVLPRFVSAALKNEPLQVYGDGNQSRCFCHVADVVDAIVRVTESPKTVGQVFNLGSDEEVTINDLAQRVISLANSSSTIQRLSYEQAYGQGFDDMLRRIPRLDKIRSAIGFKPTKNLDQIIRSVIEDQRQA